MKHRLVTIVLIVPTMLAMATPLWAQTERPTAMKLFPYETVAFARVAHGRELYQRYRQTGFGAMLQDPEVAPFVDGMWNMAGDQFTENASERVGFEWQDLEHVPTGEIAVGLVDRGQADLGLLVLADFDGQQADVDFLLEKLDERWAAEAMVVEQQDVEGDTLTIVRAGDDRSTSFGYLVKDACLVGSNDEVLLRHVLDRWAGRPVVVEVAEDEATDEQLTASSDEPLPGEQTLADNVEFQTVFRECSHQLEESPQVLLYADPLTLLRRMTRGNTGANVMQATFPALGIDGILAAGGTASFATENWDGVSHLHLLLGNPRSGVLTLLRFESGDVTPPDFVPANVYGYSTTYVDAPRIYDRLRQLVDRFRYEGAFEASIDQGISQRLGINFKEVLINNLAGRATLVTSFDEPTRMQTEQRALAVTVVDPTLAEEALKKVTEQFGERLELRDYAGTSYYALQSRRFRDRPEEERPFNPGFVILGDTLLASSSTSLIEQMIDAQQGSRPRLADSIEFKVIQSRVERLSRGQKLAMFYYDNAREVMRHWYEVSQDDTTRDRLASFENAPLAQYFLGVLEQNELPPFEKLEPYLTPTGGYLLDTNTGLHFMSFSFNATGGE